MTTWYLDLASGNDASDGGSWGTAKKTLLSITPAAGDEIRVAKTPDLTALSGTMGWTYNSATVTTSVSLVGVVAVNDLISPTITAEYGWWEVSAISADSITLTRPSPVTLSGTGYKLPTQDFVAVSTTDESYFQLAAVGGTANSPIVISGGWNTSTSLRDGYTHIRQSASTRLGRVNVSRNYWTIKHMGFHRMHYTVYSLGTYTGFRMENCFASSGATTSGAMCDIGHHKAAIIDCVFSSHFSAAGILLRLLGSLARVENCDFYNFGSSTSISLSGNNGIATGCLTMGGTSGLLMEGAFNRGELCTFISNTYGVYSSGYENAVANCTTSLCAVGAHSIGNSPLRLDNCNVSSISGRSTRSDNHLQVAGSHQSTDSLGTVKSNTVDSRSGKCMEISPNVGINVRDGRFTVISLPIPANAGQIRNVNFWIKRNLDMAAGTVRVGLRHMGSWIAFPTPVATTTSYAQHTRSTPTMPRTGVVELVIMVDGTIGSVFVDDITWN